jgi:hypothetical protein
MASIGKRGDNMLEKQASALTIPSRNAAWRIKILAHSRGHATDQLTAAFSRAPLYCYGYTVSSK